MPFRKPKTKDKELEQKVDNITKMVTKLYPRREVKVVPTCANKQPIEVDERVYLVYTRPNTNTGWQLVQQGQLGAMRRFLFHEINCGFYKTKDVATDPDENVLPFVQLVS